MACDIARQQDEDPGASGVEEMRTLQGYMCTFGSQTYLAFRSLDDFSVAYAADLVKYGDVRCLADLLLCWLTFGNAALFCPTFEIYLQTVIRMIVGWNDGNGSGLDQLGLDVFPVRDPEASDARWRVNGEPALSTVVRPGSEADLFYHPAFDRSTYELARVAGERCEWADDRVHNRTDEFFGYGRK